MHHLYSISAIEDYIVSNKMGFANAYIRVGSSARDIVDGGKRVQLDFVKPETRAKRDMSEWMDQHKPKRPKYRAGRRARSAA